MPKNDKEMLENLKARIKKQNEKAKENWDTVSCRLPKGTKERIKALGLTINGVINESVLAYLDCMEEAQAEAEQSSAETAEMQDSIPDAESAELPPVEPETPEPPITIPDAETPVSTPENGLKPLTIEDIQAMFDNRKTDEIRQEEERRERKEQEEQERRKLLANPEYAATYAQLMAMETAEKEKKRAEMLTRARLETL
nr:MAG TPA: hypothetical protein [Caudoviricetes sp.]